MKKPRSPVIPPDPALQGLTFYVRKGLRKLVPSDGLGAPPFTKYGIPTQRDEEGEHPRNSYLLVSLDIAIPTSGRDWDCYITVNDGDDMCYQRWLPLTLENWQAQLDLYNEITVIDEHTMEYLHMEGFR